MKVTIILPTYNERENIKELIPRIFEIFKKENINGNLIVVDDNSPDNTAEEVGNLSKQYPITLIERKKKLGIGSAYITGFKKALEGNSDIIFEMDADLSHNPEYIPEFLRNLKENDLVIGSRYIPGGGIENWNLYRRSVSKGANILARLLTSLDIRDITSGYRAYKSNVLRKIDLNSIKSNGYAFQLEILFKTKKEGFKIMEIPIIFTERRRGSSKLSKIEIVRFFTLCLKFALERNFAVFILLSMLLFYIFVLAGLSMNYHNDFGTSAFDLGVQDQGVCFHD